MNERFAQEIGLLRLLAEHLERVPIPVDPRAVEFWRSQGLEMPAAEPATRTRIRPGGHEAFVNLADAIVRRFPEMERGTLFQNVQVELFAQLEQLVGREPKSIQKVDAVNLIGHFEQWFEALAQPRQVFVPCVITPWPAPRFGIGPISFVFIDDITASEFYPAPDDDRMGRQQFDNLIILMRQTYANWLAVVSVEGCERGRAEEIAEIAIDLALFGLQLAAPRMDTRSMCRLDARRGFAQKHTISVSQGQFNFGLERKEPGLAIGQGMLDAILRQTQPVIAAVGNIVNAFASGTYRLRTLESAWCDAAYWMREALFDTIDSLAVTKLETALEVLICTQNSKKSTPRVMSAMQNLLKVNPDDLILPPFEITVRQFVKNLVHDRSRILHGTWSTLGARVPTRRDGLEAVVGAVMRQAAIHLDAYAATASPTDNIDAFLDWLAAQPRPATQGHAPS